MSTVSILVTSFNQADVLPQAVDSALNQSYNHIEVIIVDAASDDDSESVITQYAENNPQTIRPVLLDDDPGIPAIRNIALEHASGDYFTFLDGDDRFHPEKVERELSTIEKNNEFDAVYSNFRYVDADGSPESIWASDNPPTGDVLAEVIARQWPKGTLFRSALIDTTLLEQTGKYDESLTIYEDWDFKIRLASVAKIAYCPEILSEYRRHERGISSRVAPEVHGESMKYILQKHRSRFSNSKDGELSTAFYQANKAVMRQEAMAYLNEGRRSTAVSKYLQFLASHPKSITDFRSHLRVFLPKFLYLGIKRIHDLIR